MDRDDFIKKFNKSKIKRVLCPISLGVTLVLASTHLSASTLDMKAIERQIYNSPESLNDVERKLVQHLQEYPRNAEDHYLLACLYTQEFLQDPQDWAKLKTATDLAQQTIDLCPTCDYGFVISSQILDLMGESKKAMDLLKSVKKIYGRSSWRISFQEARLAAELKSTTHSLRLIESALALPDANHEVMIPFLIALLESEYQDEELENALIYWDRQYPSDLFQVALAEHYIRLEEFSKSHAIYASLIKKPGYNQADIILSDAILLYDRLDKPKQSIAMLENLQKNISDQTDLSFKQILMIHLANAHLVSSNQEKAKGLYLKAFALTPMSDETLFPLRRLMQNPKQQNRVSNTLFATLLEHVPGKSSLWATLAQNYSKDSMHIESAKAYSNAIILEPANSNYYVGLGIEYYHLKKIEHALSLFTTASSLDPNHAVARYNQACMLSLLGRSEEALGNLKEALELDPSLVDSARVDHDLANLYSHTSYRELIDTKPVKDHELTH